MTLKKKTEHSKTQILYEIKTHAYCGDKECLIWLLHKYPRKQQFMFVAGYFFQEQPILLTKLFKVWYPTKEGRILYRNHIQHLIDLDT